MAELTGGDSLTALVTWQKPEFEHGTISGYKLYWANKKDGIYQAVILNSNQNIYQTPALGNY